MFRRRLIAAFLAALPAFTGCMHFVHKSPEVDEFARRPADDVPDESKSCVFVFLIDPLNPIVTANTTGLRDYIQSLGFGKTYYGQSCHASYFLEKMQQFRNRSESARFVVIGYDSGADTAFALVQSAGANGIAIDRAILLAPQADDTTPEVDSMTKCFVVRADELVEPSPHDDAPTRVRKSDVPTHPKVLTLVERELILVAQTVPPPKRPDAPKVVLTPPIPAPRDTQAKPKPLAEEWQFLRPKNSWDQAKPTQDAKSETLPPPLVVPGLPLPGEKR